MLHVQCICNNFIAHLLLPMFCVSVSGAGKAERRVGEDDESEGVVGGSGHVHTAHSTVGKDLQLKLGGGGRGREVALVAG